MLQLALVLALVAVCFAFCIQMVLEPLIQWNKNSLFHHLHRTALANHRVAMQNSCKVHSMLCCAHHLGTFFRTSCSRYCHSALLLVCRSLPRSAAKKRIQCKFTFSLFVGPGADGRGVWCLQNASQFLKHLVHGSQEKNRHPNHPFFTRRGMFNVNNAANS